MKCPRCNKEGAYVRIKSQEIVCQKCGQIVPIKEKAREDDKITTVPVHPKDKKAVG